MSPALGECKSYISHLGVYINNYGSIIRHIYIRSNDIYKLTCQESYHANLKHTHKRSK